MLDKKSGVNHPESRFKKEDIINLRRLFSQLPHGNKMYFYEDMANEYNVAPSTIFNVVKGITYKNIKGGEHEN